MVNATTREWNKASDVNGLHRLPMRIEGSHRRWQITHVMDQPVRLELGNRYVGIAEADADHRNSGSASDANVGAGVADHDGRADLAARARNRLSQDRGVRFRHAERIGAADRGKALT